MVKQEFWTESSPIAHSLVLPTTLYFGSCFFTEICTKGKMKAGYSRFGLDKRLSNLRKPIEYLFYISPLKVVQKPNNVSYLMHFRQWQTKQYLALIRQRVHLVL